MSPLWRLNPVPRLRTILELCEYSLLGFERMPPRDLMTQVRWLPDTPSTYCVKCGRSGHGSGSCHASIHCDERLFSEVVRLGVYADPLATWIRELKFARWEAMGVELGRHLGEVCRAYLDRCETTIHAIVPIPMPTLRRHSRGIDHVHVLAREVAKVLDCPIKCPAGQRAGRTQARSRRTERRQRPAAFFTRRWGKPVNGENILLLDDVLTSGATAHSMCQILKYQGARNIVLAVLAVSEFERKIGPERF